MCVTHTDLESRPLQYDYLNLRPLMVVLLVREMITMFFWGKLFCVILLDHESVDFSSDFRTNEVSRFYLVPKSSSFLDVNVECGEIPSFCFCCLMMFCSMSRKKPAH